MPPALAGPVLTPVVGLNSGNPNGENQEPGFRIALMARMKGKGTVIIPNRSVTGMPFIYKIITLV